MPSHRIAATILTLVTVVIGAPAFADSRPNIVFILADDLGWRDLGCYGSTFYETPNLDRLANQGVRFTQAYAACPVCSPTRASILTGRYPAGLGTTDWFGAPQPDTVEKHWTRDKPLLPAPYLDHLPSDEATLADILRGAGYKTFFAGKWHLGGPGFYPEDHGFDINIAGHEKGSPPGGYFAPYKNQKLVDGPDGEHLPERLARETASFIESNREVPFLACLWFYSVHTPLQAPSDLQSKYEGRRDATITDNQRWSTEGDRKVRVIQDHATYAAMVEAMDAAVGIVLDALERAGVADNTVIVFTSDNGGLSTSEGHPTSNLPLRAGKGWLYEGGIREPLIMRGPGISTSGQRIEFPATSPDFLPTLLELAKVDPPAGKNIDGISLVPALQGHPLPARSLYWHYPHYGNQGGSPSAAIRTGDYKLIEFFEDGRTELYDLASDPGEQHDLSSANPDRAVALQNALDAWQSRIGARFPTQNRR